MSAQFVPQVRIEWVVAPDVEDDWPSVESCAVPQQPIDLQRPLLAGDEDEWWPGRCIV